MIELLIGLAIMTILMATAIPDLSDVIAKRSGEKALIVLANSIQAGRSAAIAGSITVTVCRSRDGLNCNGSWNQGVIVFTDRNADRILNGSDTMLRQQSFLEPRGHITWRAFQNRQYLQINSQGEMLHQNGNFTYCPFSGDSKLSHQLIINGAGRMRLARDENGDGVRQGSDGMPIRC